MTTKYNTISRERIILNVGGIKYETYRTTLTKYPETMLGTMFRESNQPLLCPTNHNEYYIDRNGRLFFFILQFYRTGKIPDLDKVKFSLPITKKELEDELDYFMIPRPEQILSDSKTGSNVSNNKKKGSRQSRKRMYLRSRTIASEVENFVSALKYLINQIILYFLRCFIISEGYGFNITIEISFYSTDKIPHSITILPTTIGKKSPINMVEKILNSYGFGTKAYALLNDFGDIIGEYFENSYSGLYWNLQRLEHCYDLNNFDENYIHDNYNCDNRIVVSSMYRVKISIYDQFDYDEIINNCCLRSVLK